MRYKLSFVRQIRSGLVYLFLFMGCFVGPKQVFSQGCIPARHISLHLGAEGVSYLDAGQWEGGISYRYLDSEDVFRGAEEQPQLHELGGRITAHSIDLSATYQIDSRFSLSLVLPFVHSDFSIIHGDGKRHSGSSGGVGDLRLLANAWVFSPSEHPNGNINLGLGLKFPTGDDRATDDYYTTSGVIIRPVDIAAQPGDGGYGIILQLQAFQKVMKNLYGYLAGFYLSNPQDVNETGRPSPLSPLVNSIPDQYQGRGGLSYVIWPSQSLSLTFGARIDGVPVDDLIGDSNGFRRAGYAIYVDPGLSWVFGKNSLSVNVPVAVERNLERSRNSSAGGFADFIVVAGYSRRF